MSPYPPCELRVLNLTESTESHLPDVRRSPAVIVREHDVEPHRTRRETEAKDGSDAQETVYAGQHHEKVAQHVRTLRGGRAMGAFFYTPVCSLSGILGADGSASPPAETSASSCKMSITPMSTTELTVKRSHKHQVTSDFRHMIAMQIRLALIERVVCL